MKKLLTLSALLFSLNAISQSYGDIAIIGINRVSNPQILKFVSLRSFSSSARITFTDKAWVQGFDFDHSLPTSDGSFTWRPGSTGITAGTVVTVSINLVNGLSASITASTGTIYNVESFKLENPDQVIAFTGDYNPHPATYLWGLSTANWDYAGGGSSTTSDLPAQLLSRDLYTTLSGAGTAYFANSTLYRPSVMMLGSSQNLNTRFNKQSLFYKSASNVNFPTYAFEISNTEPPLIGSAFSTWDFDNGTFTNTSGLYPIEGTFTPNAVPNVTLQPYVGEELETTDFPNEFSNLNLAGIVIPANLSGYNNIKLSFLCNISPHAANSLRIQYSTDGGIDWYNLSINSLNQISFYLSPNTEDPKTVLEVVNNPWESGSRLKFTVLSSTQSGNMILQVALPPLTSQNNNIRFRIVADADYITGGYSALWNENDYVGADIFFDDIQLRGTAITTASSNNINPIEHKSTLKVTPNPVEGNSNITITHNKAEKGAVISITEAQSGRLVKTQTIAEGSQQTTIPVNNLPKGKHYIVTLRSGGKETSARFFVK